MIPEEINAVAASKYNHFKNFISGTASVDIVGATSDVTPTVTIPHTGGRPLPYLAFAKTNNSGGFGSVDGQILDATIFGVAWAIGEISSTGLTLGCYYNWIGPSAATFKMDFRYFIFYD